MPATASKKNPSSARKAARALTHYLVFHLAAPWGLEYLICYGVTLIANGTLFHGRLDSPMAALGVLAAGILARYFIKPRPAVQQPTLAMGVPSFTHAELSAIEEALGAYVVTRPGDGAADDTQNTVSPYL